MATILADNIFKCIFLNENVRISNQFSLKSVPKGSIDNKPALVQVMAWRRIGDKPIIWTNADPIHCRIYAAPGGDELTAGLVIFSSWWYHQKNHWGLVTPQIATALGSTSIRYWSNAKFDSCIIDVDLKFFAILDSVQRKSFLWKTYLHLPYFSKKVRHFSIKPPLKFNNSLAEHQ